jgi:protease I
MSETAEKQAVLKTIMNYRDGTYTADTALLQSVFHENAVMNGYLGPDLVLADPSVFIADIGGSPSMESAGDPYELAINELFIEGNTASAVVTETGFRGDATLVDCFHLLKVDGSWLIVSKLFTTC